VLSVRRARGAPVHLNDQEFPLRRPVRGGPESVGRGTGTPARAWSQGMIGKDYATAGGAFDLDAIGQHIP
jgi:hypothetical protein